MSPSLNRRTLRRKRRSAGSIAAGALILLALVGCSQSGGQPILSGTPTVKLLPSKSAVAELFGAEWAESTAPEELPRTELTPSDKADPERVGAGCAKASDDFYATFHAKDGARVSYNNNGPNSAVLAVLRMATVAKATVFVEKFGAIGKACENSPGSASIDTRPLKSSVPGAVGFGSIDGSDGVPHITDRTMVIAKGDLVIMITSNLSTDQIDKLIRLELDTITKLANAG